jgi:hypothetical protein
MKYLALIYSNENNPAMADPAAQKAEFDEYYAYEGWLATEHKGKKLAGEALTPSNTATTLRIRDGKLLTTDGPFAETKEQLGGFYMYEAKDLDEAIKLAAKIPTAKFGCVEVRPVMVFDGMSS